MKPNELSGILRRIATAIENSKQPSRSAVAEDLKKLISKLAMVGKTRNFQNVGHKGGVYNVHIEPIDDRGVTCMEVTTSLLRGEGPKGNVCLSGKLYAASDREYSHESNLWFEPNDPSCAQHSSFLALMALLGSLKAEYGISVVEAISEELTGESIEQGHNPYNRPEVV